MFSMPQLIGKDLVKKQNERIASEIVKDLSTYIDNKNLSKEFATKAVNETLTRIFKKDNEFAKLILKILKTKFESYEFAIDSS